MLIIKRTLLRNSFSLLFILIVINPKSNGCVNKGISKIYPIQSIPMCTQNGSFLKCGWDPRVKF